MLVASRPVQRPWEPEPLQLPLERPDRRPAPGYRRDGDASDVDPRDRRDDDRPGSHVYVIDLA